MINRVKKLEVERGALLWLMQNAAAPHKRPDKRDEH